MIATANSYIKRIDAKMTAAHEATELVQYAERLAQDAYMMLKHMEGSDADHIPPQIVAPFQRWARDLKIASDLFFRADHVANYELRPVDLKAWVSRINDPSPLLERAAWDINWPFLRVTVPAQALGMLPHFAVVAHELGHAIEDRIVIDLDTDYGDEDAASIARTKARLDPDQVYGAAGQIERQKIVSRWLNELKADAVAHNLVGPAYFFAFSGFLELAGQGLGIGTSHPPTQIRRKLLFERLSKVPTGSKRSFAEIFHHHTSIEIREDANSPHLMAFPGALHDSGAPAWSATPPTTIDALFDDLANKFGQRKAAICVELVPLIEALGGTVYDAVERYLASKNPMLLYTPERLHEDLEDHLTGLTELIPPIEKRPGGKLGPPTSFAGILNVGWAALLGKLNEIPAPNGADESGRIERLHELLLKALELSEARMLWEEAE